MICSAENPPTGPHRVAVLVRDGVMPLELGLVHQMFGSAEAAGQPLYEVVTCALRPGPVRTDADFPVLVERGPEVLDDAATVVVPASHAVDAVEGAGQADGLLDLHEGRLEDATAGRRDVVLHRLAHAGRGLEALLLEDVRRLVRADQLGVPEQARGLADLATPLPEGTPLPPPAPLFRKIEDAA